MGATTAIRFNYNTLCGNVSQIITFTNTCFSNFNFVVYPNPSNKEITIAAEYQSDNLIPNYQNSEFGKQILAPILYDVVLYDNKSNKVIVQKNSMLNNNITLNTQNLPDGNYFLHIIDGKEKIIKQIVMQH